MFRKVSINLITEAAQRVVSKVHPEQIILFGSYAYGKPNIDSDVDLLLVINKGSRKERQSVLRNASDALDPRPFPIDIVVRSKSEIKSRIKQGDFFLQDVMKHGRILYER